MTHEQRVAAFRAAWVEDRAARIAHWKRWWWLELVDGVKELAFWGTLGFGLGLVVLVEVLLRLS